MCPLKALYIYYYTLLSISVTFYLFMSLTVNMTAEALIDLYLQCSHLIKGKKQIIKYTLNVIISRPCR